ncbi:MULTISPECIES: hypothetical protein [Thiorhodovibrio]|uniref:hypothetical protein n=1 Tax=Thiorhodovibrio TaxID=61593 RepID=UPI00191458CE|nr:MULTISPECIES: hypothetical protein [Thiorhodovibrio]
MSVGDSHRRGSARFIVTQSIDHVEQVGEKRIGNLPTFQHFDFPKIGSDNFDWLREVTDKFAIFDDAGFVVVVRR